MDRVEQYIKDYTRNCSNAMPDYFDVVEKVEYYPWLTPDHARAVAEKARQEVIDKACEWLRRNVDSSMWLINFRKYMEE